eukprot:1158273-Pelagomonas_calceolata.AAC.3
MAPPFKQDNTCSQSSHHAQGLFGVYALACIEVSSPETEIRDTMGIFTPGPEIMSGKKDRTHKTDSP